MPTAAASAGAPAPLVRRPAPPAPAPTTGAAGSEEERGSRGWELTLFRHLNYPGPPR